MQNKSLIITSCPEALLRMGSPIRYTLRWLHLAIAGIAPERQIEIAKAHGDLTLVIVDSPEWICRVEVDKREIQISRRVAEVLWAASLAYFRLYTDVFKNTELNGIREVNLIDYPESKSAFELLSWAFESWLNRTDIDWPEKLPRPQESPVGDSDEHVADELCLSALAYMLHHELAHIRLKDNDYAVDWDAEKAADQQAAVWVLEGAGDEDDGRFLKRCFGIATAFTVLTAFGLYTGRHEGKKHPPDYDRLVQTLQSYITDENHKCWAFIVAALTLHLSNCRLIVPDVEHESFLDCVNFIADILSRQVGRADFGGEMSKAQYSLS